MCDKTRKNSTDTTFFYVRSGVTTQPQIKWAKFKHDAQAKYVCLGFNGTIWNNKEANLTTFTQKGVQR